jgi:hypothetical protein
MYTYIEREPNEKLLKNVKGESEDTLKYPVVDEFPIAGKKY